MPVARLSAPALLLPVLGATGLVYLYGHPPYGERAAFPPCPLQALTGLFCPLCGGTRMTYELLHGDLTAAWALNPFLLVAAPVLLAVLVRQTRAYGRQGLRLSRDQGRALLLAALLWAVARNLARLL